MTDRLCETCRHYEPATTASHGWCRNPRLWQPQQSMLVNAKSIDCATAGYDFWEPVLAGSRLLEESKKPGSFADRPKTTERNDEEVSAYVNAGYSKLVTQRDASKLPPEGPAAESGVFERDVTGTNLRKRDRTRQERTVSYQNEERYWSDYLRIALPIAGLLLLLGVFWYWANSFIGDDNTKPAETTQVAVATTPLTTLSPVPTASQAELITPPTAEPTTANVIKTQVPGDQTGTGDIATVDTTTDGGTAFTEGDIVIVNDDDVNMRADATTNSEVVDTLAAGDELRILDSQSVSADDRTWWNVDDTTNGIQGWVAEEFLEPAEG